MSSESPNEGPDEFEGLPPQDRRNLMGMRRAMRAEGTPEEAVRDAVKTQYFVLLLSHELERLKKSDYPLYLKVGHIMRNSYQKSVFDPENEKHFGNVNFSHWDANEMYSDPSSLIPTMCMPERSVLREDMVAWLRGQPAAADFLKVLERFQQFKPD